jgi:hypothetical protein
MGGKPAVVYDGTGVVKEVRPNSSKGGWDIVTEGDAPNAFIPQRYRAPWESKRADQDRPSTIQEHYKPGTQLRPGDVLTDGVANPKAILAATKDVGAVQDYMTARLHGLFAPQGILRRNVETVVKSLTDAVEIQNPGGSPFLPGQRVPRQQVARYQQQFPELTYRPILQGVDIAPREKTEDWLAKLNYNNLRNVVTESAQIGAEANYHSTNPIPALAVGRQFGRPPSGKAEQGRY